MATGRDIIYSIKSKKEEIDDDLQSVLRKIVDKSKEENSIRSREIIAFQKLAKEFLKSDLLVPQSIYNKIERREKNIESTTKRLDLIKIENAELTQKRSEQAKIVNAANDLYQKANKERIEELNQNQEFLSLQKELSEKETSLHSAGQKFDRALEEEKKKAPQYLTDIYFSYLNNRKFGTKEYKASKFVERMDAWIAKLLNYEEKKRDFDILKGTPVWIDERIKTLKEDIDNINHQIENVEMSGKLKISGLHADLKKQNEKFKLIDTKLLDLENERKRSVQYLQEASHNLVDAQDKDFKEITEKFGQLISEMDPSALKRAVEKSPGREDDRLLAEILDAQEKSKQNSREIRELQKKEENLTRQIDNLNQLERKMKSKSWTGSSDRFSKNLSNRDLDELVVGVVTVDALWRQIQQTKQADYTPPTWSGSSSSSSSSSSGWSSGGGFGGDSGGSWSSGGGFGGGDSNSGGGF